MNPNHNDPQWGGHPDHANAVQSVAYQQLIRALRDKTLLFPNPKVLTAMYTLSGKGDLNTSWSCPVCKATSRELNTAPFLVTRDVVEGVVCESFEGCANCFLYSYNYSYGGSFERIGFFEWSWQYHVDVGWKKRQVDRQIHLAEAVTLWSTGEFQSDWRPVWHEWVVARPPKSFEVGVFADWLLSNDFPASAAVLHALAAHHESPGDAE